MKLEGILFFISGISIFLLSISRLNFLIQKALGISIREHLKFATESKRYGLLSGILVTLLFQSSSATTVLLVSMVSAGVMSFGRSLPIILGSDIGTSLTTELVVLKVTHVSPLILSFGLVLFLTSEGRRKALGEGVLFFGLLLFGLYLLSKGLSPERSQEIFRWLVARSENPYFVFLTSFLFTTLVQSSLIPISLAIFLSQANQFGISWATSVVLGANLGTTITAILASLVSNVEGKKVAYAHVIFKLVGVLVIFLFFRAYNSLLDVMPVSLGQKIVLSHLFFNLIISGIFFPFLGFVESFFEILLPKRQEVLYILPQYLDRSCLKNPDEALLCVKKELDRGLKLAREGFVFSMDAVELFRKEKKRKVEYIEIILDGLEREIIPYLWEASSFEMTERQSRRLFAYTAMVHSIERLGDHARNIAEAAEVKAQRRTFFSQRANEELGMIKKEVLFLFDDLSQLFENPSKDRIEALRKRTYSIEQSTKVAFLNHLDRFYCKICRKEAGPLFVDILTDIEGIARHLRFICDYLESEV